MHETDIFQHFAFVVLADVPYRGGGVSPKHLIAQWLSMSYPVYFVEPPPGVLDALLWRKGASLAWSGRKPAEAEYNLRLVQPPALSFPLEGRIKALDTLHQVLLGRFLRRLLDDQGVKNFILWSFRYDSGLVMQILRPDVAVYHALGRPSADVRRVAAKGLIDDLEAATIQAAHLVFTSSELLQRQFAQVKRESYYSPMGVDYKLFHTALRSDLRLPDDLEKIPAPRVGYVGVLEHWLDLGLLEFLVSSMPDVSFVFIGRYGPWLRLESLAHRPNVHLLGARPRGTLPAYLKWMDACIIPFKINELTLHSSPLKIFEYLAAGKPVVSTPIHEVERFADFIEIARDRASFAAKLRQALADRDINRANARAEIARHYSWNQRIAEMLEQIGRFVVGAEERPW